MLGILLILLSGNSYGFILPDHYLSGEELCEKNNETVAREYSKWVNVPINYKVSGSNKTKIYTYTLRPFNPLLPTLLYFTGGPGVSSRSSEFNLPNTNIIFFEQRGVSCSRPVSKEIFLNPTFYSSENTARDAFLIMKAYNITSMTIYGHSYGTIPATIFASFFPESTDSVILEGVIYSADHTLWNSQIKKNLLQNFFNSLSKDKQDKIIELSDEKILPENWFSKLGNLVLYLDHGITTFSDFLDNVLKMSNEEMKNFIATFYPIESMAEEFSFGDVMMGMIGCQELSMNDPELSLTLKFEDRILVYDKNNVDYIERCVPLNLQNSKPYYYQAKNYPVKVPVTYLLGENDGATDLHQGINHAKHVAKNKFQVLVMKEGGHLPNLGLLKENRFCDPKEVDDRCESLRQNKEMVSMFEKIINHKSVEKIDIDNFNRSGNLQWILN